ncbi:MAG: Rpn family recombination-promoting nuclease/putative transposase [Desulfovibrio sp.]|nr:Rpn family recombination-promoting nuclease/putative transposase [Desulfovibrio sp.]
MEKKPLSPKNDYVFKKIFGENLTVLTDFLKAVLDLPDDEYKGLEVLDPTLRADNIGDKYCILDIRLHTKSKDVIDIEIQIKYQEFIWKRIQFYTSKMIVEQAKSGDSYETLPHVISILITDFVLIRENVFFHNRFRLYDEKTQTRFPDSMEINVLEIPKVREDDGSQLSNWLRFFAAKTEEDFMALSQTSPAIAEAWGVIKHLSADESARMIAESREKARMDMEAYRETGRREGLREGRLEGEQKGRLEGERKGRLEGEQKGLREGLLEGERKGLREGKLEVARNALHEKLPLETVVALTGLSLEEVEQLASSLRDQH